MKNKKKWTGLLVMSLVVALSLAACGKKEDEDATATTKQTLSSDVIEESTKGSKEEVSEESTKASLETEESVEETETSEALAESTEENAEESIAESMEESSKVKAESAEAEKETQKSSEEEKQPAKEEGSEPAKESVAPSAPSVEEPAPSKEPEPEVPAVEAPAPRVEQPPAPPAEEPVPPAVHTCSFDGGSVTTAPTCSAEGVKTFTCSCGATRTESVPATGHNYVTESRAANCNAVGFERVKCSSCGDIQSETITPKTNHDLYDTWFLPPTCTYAGDGHLMLCRNCDYRKELPLGALGHQMDAGTVIYEGTCTERALYSHLCTRCGSAMPDTKGDTDPNNHSWRFDDEYQAWYCSSCGILK